MSVEATQGIQEVNKNVAQSSAVSAEIARDIAQVSRVSVEIKDSSDRVSGDAIASIFAELVDYTRRRHFGDEEKMMRKYHFEGLSLQENQHKHFAKKMREMQQQVKTGNAVVTMDLMNFLKDWLFKHIQGTDKDYQAFFKSKGVA